MKVRFATETVRQELADVPFGSVVSVGGTLYLVTNIVTKNEEQTVVSLQEGHPKVLGEHEWVEVIDGEFVVP